MWRRRRVKSDSLQRAPEADQTWTHTVLWTRRFRKHRTSSFVAGNYRGALALLLPLLRAEEKLSPQQEL